MSGVPSPVLPGGVLAKLVGVLFGDGVVPAVLEGADEKVFSGVDLHGVADGRGRHHQGGKPAGDLDGAVFRLAALLVRVLRPDDAADVRHVGRRHRSRFLTLGGTLIVVIPPECAADKGAEKKNKILDGVIFITSSID